MNFKQWLENAGDLRGQLNTQAEEIDYLVDIYLRWHRCMTYRKQLWRQGTNRDQYEAARKEETELANIFARYPSGLRQFAQQLARQQL